MAQNFYRVASPEVTKESDPGPLAKDVHLDARCRYKMRDGLSKIELHSSLHPVVMPGITYSSSVLPQSKPCLLNLR